MSCLLPKRPDSSQLPSGSISAPIRWEWAEPVCVLKSPSCGCRISSTRPCCHLVLFLLLCPQNRILCLWQDGFHGYAFVTWGGWLPPWLGGFLTAVNPAFCVPGGSTDLQNAGRSPGAEISPHSATNKDFSRDWTFWVWQQKDRWKAKRDTK